jgi:sulfatase maturation enzyme AslB (radical SAM superfamily)
MQYEKANNKDDILRNLPILLDYLDEQNFNYVDYDIYSGEFFQLPYWEEVLEIFYKHQLKVNKQRYTTIPTNYSFIADEELTARVEYWIEKMKECKAPFHLSCSIDGPEETDNKTRPNHKKGIVKDKAFYDKVFKFLAKHSYACHPMVS